VRARVLVASIGIPAYAVFMALAAPASFIASRASQETQGRVRFSETEGTLWKGSMRAHVDAPAGAVEIDRIAWRLVPAKLVEGRVAFDVEMDSQNARAKAQVLRGWSEWEARGAAARIAAPVIAALVPLAAAWRPEGAVNVTADHVRWNEREMHGPVTIEWLDAAVSLSNVKPLGAYRLVANGAGEVVPLAISTLSGPLMLSGKGEARIPGGVTFSGEARAEGSESPQLEPLLNLMGPKRPDGARAIEIRIR
jgi:general secretion pathway protein N